MTKVEKIRPDAEVRYDYGNDGRDGRYYISYCCPKCGRLLFKGDIACDRCGTFFDWSKTASIEIIRKVMWN